MKGTLGSSGGSYCTIQSYNANKNKHKSCISNAFLLTEHNAHKHRNQIKDINIQRRSKRTEFSRIALSLLLLVG